MNRKFIILLILTLLSHFCKGQENDKWEKWMWLMGNWIGEGSGQPGQGSGTFSFSFDLDKNVLIRRGYSEYPAPESGSRIIHEDLMLIYSDSAGTPDKAVYFDNEGHTIFYIATFSEGSITLTSLKSKNPIIFRLVYSFIDNETMKIQFEISEDGIEFNRYLEGTSKKAPSSD